MSVDILWQAIRGHYISTGAPGGTIETLQRAFGDLPLTLDEDSHADMLRGIAAADKGNPAWGEILHALEKHGQIRLWAEW